jgi:uncharacterized protein (DUF952 family)
MIYHLLPSDEWENLLESDASEYRPASLETEGFIHCSTEAQLLESARLFFGEYEELAVLEIVPKRVRNLLKWEMAPKRGEEFPHLYGPLPLNGVENTFMLMRLPGKDWEIVK